MISCSRMPFCSAECRASYQLSERRMGRKGGSCSELQPGSPPMTVAVSDGDSTIFVLRACPGQPGHCSCSRWAQRQRHTEGDGSRSPKGRCESISALPIQCNVQQIAVVLLSVPSWLADVENQRYCRKKHINDLEKKCFSDFLQLLLL